MKSKREPHGEKGHLNILVRDQDSDLTGFGQHNRLVVFGDIENGMLVSVSIREDLKWGLPLSTEKQRRKVANGWTRQHPKGTKLVYKGSEEDDNSFGKSIWHRYEIAK